MVKTQQIWWLILFVVITNALLQLFAIGAYRDLRLRVLGLEKQRQSEANTQSPKRLPQ
jgi:hypothetical protein